MVEDAPDDQVFDLSYQALWPNHPYGYSILGTRDTVSALSAEDLKQLHGRAYFPGNCVIAAAGNLEHEGLDRKSTRLNSSHTVISYAVFCLKKKNKIQKKNN